MKFTIQASPTADTRTCDWSKVTAEAESQVKVLREALEKVSDYDCCSCADNDHDHGNAACAREIAVKALGDISKPEER